MSLSLFALSRLSSLDDIVLPPHDKDLAGFRKVRQDESKGKDKLFNFGDAFIHKEEVKDFFKVGDD